MRSIGRTARQFWAFQRAGETCEPGGEGLPKWPRNEVDFLRAGGDGETQGLKPVAPADKAQNKLLRRATFDLTGLPLDARRRWRRFREGPDRRRRRLPRWSIGCWRRRIMASAGDGTTAGRGTLCGRPARTASPPSFYPNGYRYRDWVVGALNDDMGYDRFIKLQIAADRDS